MNRWEESKNDAKRGRNSEFKWMKDGKKEGRKERRKERRHEHTYAFRTWVYDLRLRHDDLRGHVCWCTYDGNHLPPRRAGRLAILLLLPASLAIIGRAPTAFAVGVSVGFRGGVILPAGEAGDAKVGQPDVTVGVEEDVLHLEVAIGNAEQVP
jgi:hypothetical protein